MVCKERLSFPSKATLDFDWLNYELEWLQTLVSLLLEPKDQSILAEMTVWGVRQGIWLCLITWKLCLHNSVREKV